ncbi:MAG: non-canonical purine NTP pyrophosphatase [Candidatus Manganitrophus sp.]|nr:non-canonical purine NTP pyrophosphatase [Candidatus Manganitrophus sp.]
MVLVIATENKHKGEELASILRQEMEIDVRTLADFPGVKLPPETGSTYRENAVQKALAAAKATGHWALGDDSGLEVDALGGAPGLYSARFAGEGVTYADNRKKVLDALGDRPDDQRTARFLCTIAIVSPDGKVEVVEGRCEGRITRRDVGGRGIRIRSDLLSADLQQDLRRAFSGGEKSDQPSGIERSGPRFRF